MVPLLLAAASVFAQDNQKQTRAKLDALQGQIKQLDRELSSARGEREKLLAQLREADKALGQLQNRMADIRKDIADLEGQLGEMEARQRQLEAERQGQRERIASELATAWKLGRQEQIKILLNQEDPNTVARAMAYYRYVFDARSERIEAYRATLAELAQVSQDIAERHVELEQSQAALAAQQQELAASKEARQAAAAALAADISAKGDTLAQLKKDQKELEQLLQTIERAAIEIDLPDNAQSFAEARGKMPWPVAGKPSNLFGRARNDGKMRWQGVNIPAAAGEPVRAIHNGRVVYADWFRGSGLLLIIDHGDGYMSLYAHNQALLREVGEWVNAGATIGSVGESGGLERPALYFEIRHKGKPVDPARWCRG